MNDLGVIDPRFKEPVSCVECGSYQKKVLFESLPGVVSCLNCGLAYTTPRLKKSALQNLYSKSYFESHSSQAMGYDNYVSDEALVRKTFEKRLGELEEISGHSKGRLLDVGCATGFFLSVAKNRGWHSQGVEISKYACEYAEKKFGIDVHNGFFEDWHTEGEGFDLITMWDYIEHSLRPDLDIRTAHRFLKPGGYLAITTPDFGSLPAKVFGQKWMGFKEHEHLFYFTKDRLINWLESEGFKIVRASYAGKHVSVPFFLKRLSQYSGPLSNWVSALAEREFMKRCVFYCNPFDIVYIVAQKTR